MADSEQGWWDDAKSWFRWFVYDEIYIFVRQYLGPVIVSAMIALGTAIIAFVKLHPTIGGVAAGAALTISIIVALALIDGRRRRANAKKNLPDIVYDHCREHDVTHEDGKVFRYTHLVFRNRPSGRTARDVAARITFLKPGFPMEMFAVDAKWYEVPHTLGRGILSVNKIELPANNSPHPLDLLIRAPSAADCFGLHVDSSYRDTFAPQYRVPPGDYKIKVTLSCEGYTQDFWFDLRNHGSPPVMVNPAEPLRQ